MIGRSPPIWSGKCMKHSNKRGRISDHLSTRSLSTFPIDQFRFAERRLATPFLIPSIRLFLRGPQKGPLFFAPEFNRPNSDRTLPKGAETLSGKLRRFQIRLTRVRREQCPRESVTAERGSFYVSAAWLSREHGPNSTLNSRLWCTRHS